MAENRDSVPERWRRLPEPPAPASLTALHPASPPPSPESIIDAETMERLWIRG